MIGSELTNTLKGNVAILTKSNKNQSRVTKVSVKTVIKNILDIKECDVEGYDAIYHCASTVDNYNVLTDPFVDVETNIKGTITLLEACKSLPVKPKIIYLSSFFVYGNEYSRTKKPINEESKTDPLASYPATKLCAESIIKLYSRLYKIPYIICRLTNVYGEKEDYTNPKKGALNYLIMKMIKGEPISIYKGGNFLRDYVYVTDVVSAINFLVRKGITNDTYLIGYGKPVLFKSLIDYIYEITGKKSKIAEVEPPEFHKIVGTTDFVADTSKINSLGWTPKINYKNGIKRIVKTYNRSQLI